MSNDAYDREFELVPASEVHEVIRRSMLGDGLPFVLDLDRSQGTRIVDKLTGRAYLDFFTYFATQPIGHNHPAMTDERFLEHLARVASTNPSNSDLYTEEMAAFVDVLFHTAQPKSLPHLFLIAGGALAVENGLKAAFDWKYQKRVARGLSPDEQLWILHFKEAFHGRSGYTLSLTNTEPTKVRWFPKFDWPRVSNPKIVWPLEDHLEEVIEAEKRSLHEIETILERDGHRVAALIIEPIQGEGGDNHFRGEFLRALREITLQHEVLFIVDEVQTGGGSTGKWWAYQHFGFEPDVLCFGKKMQVCGIMASERVNEVESVFKVPSRINSTWGGSLVDMVRATRYLQVIDEEGLVENAARQGERLLAKLQEVQARHPELVSDARGRGLMVAFAAPDGAARKRLLTRMRELGLLALAAGQQSIRFRPPLTVQPAEIDEAVQILEHALEAE